MENLTPSEFIRYSRQMMIRGWGEKTQKKIKGARVAIAGIGGLGSPVSLYLAAAGVGYLRLIDSDVVDLSNLNRQVIHWGTDLGRPKVESAAMKLTQLNPEVKIDPINETITPETVTDLLKDVDLVMDGLDSLASRMVINNEIVKRGIPYVYSAVYGMEGFMTTIIPGQSPCLKCIYPAEFMQSGKFPVIGTTPGVIGNLEATEGLKILTGLGKPAIGRLIVYDGERMTFDEVAIKRSDRCTVCCNKK